MAWHAVSAAVAGAVSRIGWDALLFEGEQEHLRCLVTLGSMDQRHQRPPELRAVAIPRAEPMGDLVQDREWG